MDGISLVSYSMSTCCHLAFVAWMLVALPTHDVEKLLETQDPIEEPIPESSQSLNKKVPEFAVLIPERDAVVHGAIPEAVLPELDNQQLFENALLKPILGGNKSTIAEQQLTDKTSITLPKVQIDQSALLKFDTNKTTEKNKHQDRSDELHNFVYVINIIVGAHYYKKWKKRFHKHISNFEIQLIIHTINSSITQIELIKGSGHSAFDEVLLRWVHHVKPNGPSIPDGQYPMLLKLK